MISVQSFLILLYHSSLQFAASNKIDVRHFVATPTPNDGRRCISSFQAAPNFGLALGRKNHCGDINGLLLHLCILLGRQFSHGPPRSAAVGHKPILWSLLLHFCILLGHWFSHGPPRSAAVTHKPIL